MSLHSLHGNRQKLLIQRIRVILKTLHRVFTESSQSLHHQKHPQERAGDKQASGEITNNCNQPDLVAKFKEAVVAIREKGGNITKAQLASELGCTRKDVSENRDALQQAVEELEA